MKELSIEEKAKAYDEALERAKSVDDSEWSSPRDIAEYIFPQIAESEDERIRKALISFLKSPFVNENITDEKVTPWIAWLEKQGEHANFRDSIQVGDNVTRNKDGILVNLSQLNRVAKKDEKQGEQKPDTDFSDLKTWKYIVEAVWTEKDDVGLYFNSPFNDKVAKKLQKRFGNIEQKPILDVEIPFGAKDSELVEEAITIPDGCYAIIEDNKVILRKGEKKSSWSEMDESMLNFVKIVLDKHKNDAAFDELETTLSDCLSWFRDIKSRVGCEASCTTKQEWSEEDKERIEQICDDLKCGMINFYANEVVKGLHYKEIIESNIEWLKSLRPQLTWKPSEEEMKALSIVMCGVDDPLFSLYQDLKKLRGE